jgi:hypothetical protein
VNGIVAVAALASLGVLIFIATKLTVRPAPEHEPEARLRVRREPELFVEGDLEAIEHLRLIVHTADQMRAELGMVHRSSFAARAYDRIRGERETST